MHDTEHLNPSSVRQTPTAGPRPVAPVAGIPDASPAAVTPLLTKDQFRSLLGGMSERKFDQLLADGVINAPLELGPRCARWTHSDFTDALSRLPRRAKAPEPETLAKGRRARIAAMKRGAEAVAA